MKKYLIIASIFIGNLSQAQRFQHYYAPSAGLIGNDVLTTGIDNVVGTGAAAAGYFNSAVGGTNQVRAVKVADDGSPIFNQVYTLRNTPISPSETNSASSMTSRVVAGVQNYAIVGKVGSTPDALFMNVNDVGAATNIVRYNFGAGSKTEATCIRPSSFFLDNFYICGNTTPANIASAYSRDFFLNRVTGAGAIAISNKYSLTTTTGAAIYTSANSVIEIPGTSTVFIVGQAVQISLAGVATKSGLLVKIDGNTGNLLNAYTYGLQNGGNGRIEGFKAIRKQANGKYMVLGNMNILPAGGVGIGSGQKGDVLISFDLTAAVPTIIWQKGYNFNTGLAASIAPINGTDLFEVVESTGAISYVVSGKYVYLKEKSVFKVDQLGVHQANNRYETGKSGDLFALAKTGDAMYLDAVLGFGTSPNGNYTMSYIEKSLPSLATIASAACNQTGMSKYEVVLNILRTPLIGSKVSGTSSPMVYQMSSFSNTFCIKEPFIVGGGNRQSVAEQFESEGVTKDFHHMSLFPNPSASQNEINVEIQTNELEAVVEILDHLGRIQTSQKILVEKAGTFTLPVSQLKNGNYFVRVKTGEGIRTQRLLKN
jgi:hypothetical protein